MCLGIDFFEFIPMGIHWTVGLCIYKIWDISAIIYQIFFSAPHSYLSTSGTPISWVLNVLLLPTGSWDSVQFFHTLSCCFSAWIHFYWSILKFSDSFMCHLYNHTEPNHELKNFFLSLYISFPKVSFNFFFVYSVSLMHCLSFHLFQKWNIFKIVALKEHYLLEHFLNSCFEVFISSKICIILALMSWISVVILL